MTTELTFSPWASWNERKNLKDINKPGIYLLAHFNGSIPTKVDYKDKKVICIGQTAK